MACALPDDSDDPMETVEKTVHDLIKEFDPKKHDRIIGEKLNHLLLEIKTTPDEQNIFLDGFVYCWLIVQSAKSSTDKNRFRVKTTWTGMDVKKEIERLYEIPPHFQTLIINERVVSDAQTLEAFNIQPTGQIIYSVLTKKKLRNAGPVTKLSDFIPTRAEREARLAGAAAEGMDVDTDGSSDATPEPVGETSQPKSTPSASNRKKKKKKKGRRQGW